MSLFFERRCRSTRVSQESCLSGLFTSHSPPCYLLRSGKLTKIDIFVCGCTDTSCFVAQIFFPPPVFWLCHLPTIMLVSSQDVTRALSLHLNVAPLCIFKTKKSLQPARYIRANWGCSRMRRKVCTVIAVCCRSTLAPTEFIANICAQQHTPA